MLPSYWVTHPPTTIVLGITPIPAQKLAAHRLTDSQSLYKRKVKEGLIQCVCACGACDVKKTCFLRDLSACSWERPAGEGTCLSQGRGCGVFSIAGGDCSDQASAH